MYFEFSLAIAFTILVSALCSILEAMILSTTTAEIEALKKSSPKRGEKLERRKLELEETSSAILSLNTIANTLGATMVGGLAVNIWSESSNVLFNISISMAIAILFFSEIIPKNLGVLYRVKLQPTLIYPLDWICTLMTPISKTVGAVIKLFIKPEGSNETDTEEEIMLLAEKVPKKAPSPLTNTNSLIMHSAWMRCWSMKS